MASRKNDDFTQRIEVLEDAGKKIVSVRPATVRAWKRGESFPGFEAIHAILSDTGCDPLWLLTGEGEPFPPPNVPPDTSEAVTANHRRLCWAIENITRAALDLWPLLSEEQRRALYWTLERASRAAQDGEWSGEVVPDE